MSCSVQMCGMIQGADGFRLPLESGAALCVVRDALRKHLDRDRAVEAGVPGPVDLSHAACSDGGLDFIRAEAGAGREGHDLPPEL